MILIIAQKILVLGVRPSYDINGSFGSLEKTFSINFSTENPKFCSLHFWSLHYNGDNKYLFVNGKNI